MSGPARPTAKCHRVGRACPDQKRRGLWLRSLRQIRCPLLTKLLTKPAPDHVAGDADGREGDGTADERVDLAEPLHGTVRRAPCDVAGGYPVGDLVDRAGEVGAGALDLIDQCARRERGRVVASGLGVGLGHRHDCTSPKGDPSAPPAHGNEGAGGIAVTHVFVNVYSYAFLLTKLAPPDNLLKIINIAGCQDLCN